MIKTPCFCLMIFFCASSFTSAADYYGAPWGNDGLANLRVGTDANFIYSIRFRAQQSGIIRSFRIHIKFDYEKAGYHSQDGGDLLFQFVHDDGSDDHYPGSTLLSSVQINDPLLPPPAGADFRHITFPNDITIEKDKFYHLVISNVDPAYDENWVSFNNLIDIACYTSGAPYSPVVPQMDWGVLRKQGASWVYEKGYCPICQFNYNNGISQGVGYTEGGASWEQSQAPYFYINGTIKVGEQFTVQGGDRMVTGASARLINVSGTGNVIVRLEEANGTLLEEKPVAAASISSTSNTWADITFNTPHMLRNGYAYRLVLSTAAGSLYYPHTMQDGTHYGFTPNAVFQDGQAVIFDGASWSVYQPYSQSRDLQFFLMISNADTDAPAAPKYFRAR